VPFALLDRTPAQVHYFWYKNIQTTTTFTLQQKLTYRNKQLYSCFPTFRNSENRVLDHNSENRVLHYNSESRVPYHILREGTSIRQRERISFNLSIVLTTSVFHRQQFFNFSSASTSAVLQGYQCHSIKISCVINRAISASRFPAIKTAADQLH